MAERGDRVAILRFEDQTDVVGADKWDHRPVRPELFDSVWLPHLSMQFGRAGMSDV
jgi:hypothetical protein